jgi:selT/selW/selH-like putative selenoprotein
LEDELIKEFGPQTRVELIPGSAGVYIVCVDDQQIFSKKELNRFPNDGEIVGLIR